ncbi:MAG TPA: C2H2-type zinc finger protein [Thermoplasmata archaeon]|nr:C2H2-type zinc finger protein [Thermoplasmata archaeon]
MEAARRNGPAAAPELSLGSPVLEIAQLLEARAGPVPRLERLAELADGKEDALEYHSPDQVRRHWFAEWRQRVGYGPAGDYDNSILVTAKRGKGQGKSALAIEAALQVDRKFGAEYRAKIAFKPAAFLDVVNSLSRFEAAVLDEAGDSLLRTEFWSDASRLLTKAMIVSRDTHATVFLCIPTIGLFNSAVLNSLVDYWIRVDHRGLARVHPRPDERYSKVRGIGWFPEREWDPYTWPNPKDWPPEWKLVWGEYRKLRKEFRQESLEGKAEELRKGGPTQASGRRQACDVCGVSFQRRDQLRRHLGTAKHLDKATARQGGGVAHSARSHDQPAQTPK